IVNIGKPLPAKLAVARERALAHEVIAKSIAAELRDDFHRLDDIPERLADLLRNAGFVVFDVDEAVSENSLGFFHSCRPQHRGPKCTVKARNILTDEVSVAGPPRLERSLIVTVADSRDVSQQRIEPNPDGEVGVERNADAPIVPMPSDVHVL